MANGALRVGDGRMGVKQGGTHAVQDDRLALRKRRPSLLDAACENIRASILSGVHRPAAQLPTAAEFVDVLRVSRSVIREALASTATAVLLAAPHGQRPSDTSTPPHP